MNNFEAKYIKLSSRYLAEKLQKLRFKEIISSKIEEKKESPFKHLITSIFKS